jgi:ribose transport system ATP-binding protein
MSMLESEPPILQLRGVSKRYPGVVALDGVDFDLRPGELHVVLGENGAGKSTLIKTIAGVTFPDEGEILFDGEPAQKLSVSQRKALGISVIHQELNLVAAMTIVQNIFLGNEFSLGPGVGDQFRVRDIAKMNAYCVALLKRLKIDLNPRDRISNLSVSQRQLIEIAKAVAFDARVVVMDEPTTSLGPDEKSRLFELIDDLKSKGISIIYVSHVLEDCVALGDRITILRDGRHIQTLQRGEATPDSLVPLITGRSFSERYPKIRSQPGRTILEVTSLSLGRTFRDVSFKLHEGEILGFAGLVGAGRTDLMRVIAGIEKPDSGVITIDGKRLKTGTVRSALQNGVAMLTEDRKLQGILPDLDVQTNLAITAINLREARRDQSLTRFGWVLSRANIRSLAAKYISTFNIRAFSPSQKIAHLSGGNQQKVLLVRAIAAQAKILILDEPTKGIDAGAKVEIYNLLAQLIKNGKSIIVVSSEMPEVLAICNRILVMNRGRIMAETSSDAATPEKIVSFAAMAVPAFT